MLICKESALVYKPYLVYKHTDAGHPHIHLLTTNIQRDGSRIKMQNIGRNQSEKARKEIEKEFKLVQAQQKQLKEVYELKAVNVQKVQYGKSETKRAITNVLDAVLPTYKYASLPELNAILKQYNIVADRGNENSRTYKNNGLVYRVLDDKGQKIGTPIKASAIYNKPGLKFLNEKFIQNEPLKQPHKLRVTNAIDLSFVRHPGQRLDEMVKVLLKDKIQVVLRQNEKGIIYGITYIDHQNKCVFNGSELGKQYSANQIQERCRPEQLQKPRQVQHQQRHIKQINELNHPTEVKNDSGIAIDISPRNELLKELTKAEQEGSLPFELRQDQIRKRKRKRLHH
ncbi:MAG: relaxase/mobilization nuclease domain-containing protein [Ferruginibacter sp.]